MNGVKRIKPIYSVFSGCLIAFGSILMIFPEISVQVLYRVCGLLLIMFGVVKLLGYFSRDLLQLAFQFDFAMGIISLLMGCVMLVRPVFFAKALTIGMGVFMLSDGLLRIQTAIDARRIGVGHWWIILIMAVVSAGIGAMLFLKPFAGAAAVTMMIGFNLVVYGLLNLYVVQSTVNTIRRNERWEI